MPHKYLYDLLCTINIPVAYDHFKDNKELIPPFMTYREITPETFKADNKTFYKIKNYEIEVVTTKKDVALQQRIEDLLTNNNIPYDVSDEVWDGEEKIYHNYYEI